MIVLDASVALSWVLPGEDEDLAERVLLMIREEGCLVPAIWTLEVGNAITMAEREGRMTGAQGKKALQLLQGLPIRVTIPSMEADFGQVIALARRHQLTTYDASYLELALRANSRLATLDKLLASTGGKMGIDVVR